MAEETGKVKEGMEKIEKMEIGDMVKDSKGKDGEEDELDEPDRMINAAREQTEQNREDGEDDDAEMVSQHKSGSDAVDHRQVVFVPSFYTFSILNTRRVTVIEAVEVLRSHCMSSSESTVLRHLS